MHTNTTNYLLERGISIGNEQSIQDIFMVILQQKQTIILNLSEQITKYKCEDIKSQKVIKGLQDKIAQIAPSSSDTGSNFMMASQFKGVFQQFMSNIVSSAMGLLLDKPKCYKLVVRDVFMCIYSRVQQQLTIYLYNVCQVFKINDQAHNQENKAQLKLSLLKFFQQNWQVLFQLNQENLQYRCENLAYYQCQIQQINQILISEDYRQLKAQLQKICVYMILQQKKWQFVFPQDHKILSFAKKQCVCLDGWLKDGDTSLIVLEGIKRETHFHANLRNYVIPISQGQNYDILDVLILGIKRQKEIVSKTYISKDNILELYKSMNMQVSNKEHHIQDTFLPQSCIFLKRQHITIENKENYPNSQNKKSKQKQKSKQSSFSLLEKSPKNKQKKQKTQQLILRKKQSDNQMLLMKQFDEKIICIKQQIYNKKKSLNINKNLSNDIFDQVLMLPLKQRKLVEDLPMSREIIIKKKAKANTSRKNSVGKIVNQHHIINNHQQLKQNQNNIHNKIRGLKQKNYKDIIKQKMMDERSNPDRSTTFQNHQGKSKNQRQKRKEENRPLKLNNNVNKLREKYII